MSTIAEIPPLAPKSEPPALPGSWDPRASERSGAFTFFALVGALGLHALVLFGYKQAPRLAQQIEFGMEAAESSVEVELVAALPADAEMPPVVEEMPPEPEPEPVVEQPPPPPEPMPEPPVMEKPPEMTLPEPPPPPPEPPKPEVKKNKVQPKPNPKPKPEKPARAVGDGSSPIPGQDATSASRSSGSRSAKPGYLRNPTPRYPEAARLAKQEGTVRLSFTVNEQGRIVSIRISRSSGFPLLDEAALSTVRDRWTFRPAKDTNGQPMSSSVDVPIRFDLDKTP